MGGAGPFKRKLTRHGAAIENKLTIENKLNFAYGTLGTVHLLSRGRREAGGGARSAGCAKERELLLSVMYYRTQVACRKRTQVAAPCACGGDFALHGTRRPREHATQGVVYVTTP